MVLLGTSVIVLRRRSDLDRTLPSLCAKNNVVKSLHVVCIYTSSFTCID